VSLSIDNNEVNLMINGELVVSKEIHLENVEFQNIAIGRKSDEEFLHDLFPVSRINGIIDEVKLWNKRIDLEFSEFEGKASCPDLSIPKSRFENDFHRPKYHILPAANWTNESHGLIYHNGRYHIFNQKNGTNLYLGQINWGHFSSPDLVQWTEHRPVLTPEEGYDQYGIWSGHAIKDDSGKPVIFYTGGNGMEFGMCLAYPKDDNLLEWTKFEGNPVVQGPPKEFVRKDFRDPFVWRENDSWYMMVGFGIVEDNIEKGALLLYKSKDLQNWTYLHELYKSEQDVYDTGVFWEMSIFRKFGDKYVLLVNPIPYKGKPAIALYWVGEFVNERFIPDNKIPQKLELINRLLSPSISTDEEGNTIAIGIIPDLIHPKLQLKQGWTHVFSIPRIWELNNGNILQSPHPALKRLRDSAVNFNPQLLTQGKNLELIQGKHQVEIEAEINTSNTSRFGFIIGKSEEHDEETKVYFDLSRNHLIIDKSKSSKTELIENNIETGDFVNGQNEILKIHLFIDGSVVEGFINDKDAFTTRIFPKYESSNTIELFVESGEIYIENLKVWPLKSSDNVTEFCIAN
jgi:sucrose-6-phosphate hydrolase SacC (GH32 family)